MSLYFSLNCRETWFLIGGNEGQSDSWLPMESYLSCEDDTPDTAFS